MGHSRRALELKEQFDFPVIASREMRQEFRYSRLIIQHVNAVCELDPSRQFRKERKLSTEELMPLNCGVEEDS